MAGVVTVEARGSVAVVRLDDGKANALSLGMIAELGEALAVGQRTADAVVLTGRPGCLSAGLDRGIMLSPDKGAVSGQLRQVTGLYQTILDLQVPTVVACTGHALAAGALLLLVADTRIGARVPSKIGLNEVQIGLQLFPLAVAAARARLQPAAFVRATLEGTVYDCAAAATAGYLDHIVDPGELLDAAVDHAARLGRLHRRSYLATRKLIFAPVLAEVEQALARKAARESDPGEPAPR